MVQPSLKFIRRKRCDTFVNLVSRSHNKCKRRERERSSGEKKTSAATTCSRPASL